MLVRVRQRLHGSGGEGYEQLVDDPGRLAVVDCYSLDLIRTCRILPDEGHPTILPPIGTHVAPLVMAKPITLQRPKF